MAVIGMGVPDASAVSGSAAHVLSETLPCILIFVAVSFEQEGELSCARIFVLEDRMLFSSTASSSVN